MDERSVRGRSSEVVHDDDLVLELTEALLVRARK